MDPFIGQIIMFAGNFAPRGWALCQGQLLPIAQHQALFSILGTTYGGDGKTTFAVPDLRGRVPLGPGHGPGLSDRTLGQKAGRESVTLAVNEIPSHSHAVNARDVAGDARQPTNAVLAQNSIYTTSKPDTTLSPAAIGDTGGNQPHDNMQPFVGINFIIALEGTFPSRN